MQGQFELAFGSIQGREHLRLAKNNQDAYYTLSNEQHTIAIVCDGCGSGRYSEVGAQFGVRLIGEILTKALSTQLCQSNQIPPQLLSQLYQDLLSQIDNLSRAMGGNWLQTLKDYFLFTIVGVVITAADICVFSLGDGVIIVNGCELELGSFPGNAPPYLVYGLSAAVPDQDSFFQIHKLPPLAEVESILIGTDGVSELIQSAQRQLPGKPELVGSISQFWQQDRYFTNPDQVRRRLALINREVTRLDSSKGQVHKESGLLSDDTTLVVLRRKSDRPNHRSGNY
jgi:hypothetical protein